MKGAEEWNGDELEWRMEERERIKKKGGRREEGRKDRREVVHAGAAVK